ncbi:protein of unknown function [Magnetospirillum sp. XM-1]|nr:protein of unknown function [Magnetospirillum sp. XM-1]
MKPHEDRIVGSLATDYGHSCPRSCGDAEGSYRPSGPPVRRVVGKPTLSDGSLRRHFTHQYRRSGFVQSLAESIQAANGISGLIQTFAGAARHRADAMFFALGEELRQTPAKARHQIEGDFNPRLSPRGAIDVNKDVFHAPPFEDELTDQSLTLQ